MSRGALLALAVLSLGPAAAQSHPASQRGQKAARGTCHGKPATLAASPRDHLVVGTSRADVIVGTGGADQIRGGGGNDLICGGGGADLLSGGPGKDRIRGAAGGDLVQGGAGSDALTGGSGDDHLDGDDGRDECDGEGGINTYVSCEVEPTSGPPPAGQGTAPPAPAIDSLPAAADDTALLDENSGATFIDVLANDTDADGGPKTVEAVSEAAHGTVSIAADGAGVDYEPQAGYCNDGEALDTFTYRLNGGSEGTVTVRVVCVTAVSSSPPLTPSFDPEVEDYTVHCTGAPLEVTGRAAEGATVAVDGGPSTGGSFEATVPLQENQAFSFTTASGVGSKTYSVRCLPSDFSVWNYEQLQQPSHELYFVAPNLGGSPGKYVVIFDRDGVPVWWDTEGGGNLQDAKVLTDGTLAWWNAATGYVVRNPDGSLVQPVTAVDGFTDGHELQQAPNGNFLLISNETREGVDLTEYGGTTDEDVEDMVVQEVSPEGDLEWSWSTKGHIGLAETGRWWPTALSRPEPRDIIHMNAVQPDGEDAVLISVRHTDAIYKIDKATGNIVWKLGGTWTPKSLKVLGDPEGTYPFGGQHDIRLLPDGTITVHDNNTNQDLPPRAVRYSIDGANKTATMVEQVTDPLITSSFCCGSARRSNDGSWLMSWGGNSFVGEYDSTGQPTFRLKFGGTVFSYRAVPADVGGLTISSLRAGMEAMHPR